MTYDDEPTIEVLYTCDGCGLQKAKVNVKARTTEDVALWMERTAIHDIAQDHARRSPFCAAKTIKEIMIPMTGSSKIGGVSEN